MAGADGDGADNARRFLGGNASQEIESEETTEIPTDLTASIDSYSNGSGNGARDFSSKDKQQTQLARQYLQRRQILHDFELLKIELSQKSTELQTLRAEYTTTKEDLEERLADANHQQQILQVRLESQVRTHDDVMRTKLTRTRNEVEEILHRQKELEKVNCRLQDAAGEIRQSLRQSLDIGESEYRQLKCQREEDLTLRAFVAVRVYEHIRTSRLEVDRLRRENGALEKRFLNSQQELEALKHDRESTKDERFLLETRLQKLTLELADTKKQIQFGHFKVDNYDCLKRERDQLQQDLTEVRRNEAFSTVSLKAISKERDELLKEVSTFKQKASILNQDKDYLTKQSNEVGSRAAYSEQKLQQVSLQLDQAKSEREQLYEKYMNAREQIKSDYELKLRDELEDMRKKTNAEIDRLRDNMKEMYERENRNLRDARDLANSERDRAAAAEKDSTTKLEQLLQEHRVSQSVGDGRVSQLMNEVKLKSFEAERMQMVHEETVKTLKEAQLEIEKLQKKVEVLTKEFFTLQTGSEKKIILMEGQLEEKGRKLEVYEKLEQELDDVVMQAAELSDEKEAEKVLFAYGYGASVPSTAKRRMKQSVYLARRVLQLERSNRSLRAQGEKLEEKHEQLAGELKNANELVDKAQQPYSYLVESVRLRDVQIESLKQAANTVAADLKKVTDERKALVERNSQMQKDIERLLDQHEELTVMKKVILSLAEQKSISKTKVTKAGSQSKVTSSAKSSRTSTKVLAADKGNAMRSRKSSKK